MQIAGGEGGWAPSGPVEATLLAFKQKLILVQHIHELRGTFDGHADGTGASIFSEKKELLRRDYARAMSDETVISGDKCVTAENGHTKPCKRVEVDPCTLKNLVSASKEALGSRQTAAAVASSERAA
jgi:hypothetical protein